MGTIIGANFEHLLRETLRQKQHLILFMDTTHCQSAGISISGVI